VGPPRRRGEEKKKKVKHNWHAATGQTTGHEKRVQSRKKTTGAGRKKIKTVVIFSREKPPKTATAARGTNGTAHLGRGQQKWLGKIKRY